MENLIHAIIDADKQAQIRLAEAEAKRTNVRKVAEGQKKEINERYHTEAQARLTAHKEALQQELDTVKQQKLEEYDSTLKNLHETFNTNKDSWIEQIVKRCQES